MEPCVSCLKKDLYIEELRRKTQHLNKELSEVKEQLLELGLVDE